METTRSTIGLIVLDSDANCLPQHRMLLPEAVTIEAASIELKDGVVTNASLEARFESDQLEIAAAQLAGRARITVSPRETGSSTCTHRNGR